jgi:hypothetical protein
MARSGRIQLAAGLAAVAGHTATGKQAILTIEVRWKVQGSCQN